MRWHRSRHGVGILEVLAVVIVIVLLLALFLPARRGASEAARRASCAVKLKNIATALHTYHDTYDSLPPSAFYKDGHNLADKGVLLKGISPGNAKADARCAPYSIFVKLLPYMEHGETFEKINFESDEAFAPANWKLAAKVVSVQICPSFRGSMISSAQDYLPPTDSDRPALTNYKTLGATTLACLQDSASATNNELNGGVLHPYASYRFDELKALSHTAILAETKEEKYAAWWDGTTAAMPGFHPGAGNVIDDREPTPPQGVPALNVKDQGQQQAFITKDQFGGKEDMVWGPSSDHPGLVMHCFGGTESRSIAYDIDPGVYRAMISRRADDNQDIDPAFIK